MKIARYYTGAVTSHTNLADAINTVLVGEGWLQNELDHTNDEAGWHVGSLFIQAAWDNTADFNFYQSTAWDGAGTAPGAHTGDSGSDHEVTALGSSMVAYHAFTNNSVGVEFAYFVVEYQANAYRHFGFGNINKFGGWSDGEFCYGHRWDQAAGDIDRAGAGAHSVLVDAHHSVSNGAATMLITGTEWPNAPASSIWAVGHSNATIGNDTAGNGRYRMLGGSRRGFYCQEFGMVDSAAADAFVPGSPITIFAHDATYTTEHLMLMGEMPLCYVGSIDNFTDEQVVTFGSEDWMIFPFTKSSWAADPNTEQSGNAGIWYRRT